MHAHLKPNDTKLFYSYLDRCSNYLEFGSGGSTYQACLRPNVKRVVSVESDLRWIQMLQSKLAPLPSIEQKQIDFKFIDLKTRPHTWGYPGSTCGIDAKLKYSNVINEFVDAQQLDLILIDGRFRVACCLKCFANISNDCVIAFDDFIDRPQYHIVLDYYDIIDDTKDKWLVMLKKRRHIKGPSQELIRRYELIPD